MLLSTQSGDICLPEDCLAIGPVTPESVFLLSLLDVSALDACDKTYRKRPKTRTHSIALASNCSFLKDIQYCKPKYLCWDSANSINESHSKHKRGKKHLKLQSTNHRHQKDRYISSSHRLMYTTLFLFNNFFDIQVFLFFYIIPYLKHPYHLYSSIHLRTVICMTQQFIHLKMQFLIQESDIRLCISHISFLGLDEWCYWKQFTKVESAVSNNNLKLSKQQRKYMHIWTCLYFVFASFINDWY